VGSSPWSGEHGVKSLDVESLLDFQCRNDGKIAFSSLTLLVGLQEGHPACKKQCWGTGMTVSASVESRLVLVPAHLGSPGKVQEGCKMVVCV